MSARPSPDTPQAWLERARSDLALARAALNTPEVWLEDACFHAQQCAEKALKGLLVQCSVAFPRTHAIELLLDLLLDAGIALPDEVNEAFVLTQYAVETRYPGAWEPVTVEETRTAIDTAVRVLTWVETQVSA